MPWPWASFSQRKRKLIAKARSDTIDRQIMEDRERCKKECKILLLGSHESGKRVIVNQMKIIHQGFDARERNEYRAMIYKYVLDSAGTLARVVRRAGVGTLEEGERAHAALLLAAFPAADAADKNGDGEVVEIGVDPEESEEDMGIQPWNLSARPGTAEAEAQTNVILTPGLADAIWHVARAPAVERLLDEQPAESYLMDNALYFFASIHRIAAPTYVPSEEDILRTSANTTTIIETPLSMGALSIRIIDVGGMRSERRKWIHCFENVTSILFCTALSEYDQVLSEEQSANRLHESISLFDSVINSRWFSRTSVVLFLTKVDEFEQKLSKIPLERYFPEYVGGNDVQSAVRFVLWRFMQANRARLSVYPHITQTTDTNHINLVFAAVKETILQNALKDSRVLRHLPFL
ncbi:heterotrimeric G protein alpha subunit 2 [Mycena leptocephala]|nr:heterotrimeric G protein alpha subunit 2 [Mycena leptocephala]